MFVAEALFFNRFELSAVNAGCQGTHSHCLVGIKAVLRQLYHAVCAVGSR